MQYSYRTQDTCSTDIRFDITDGVVSGICFEGGCNGNLKTIPLLLEGLQAEEIIGKLEGITCGRRPTSCSDQLAKALRGAIEQGGA